MSFSTAEYLSSLNMFGIRLGLDAVRELARRAGNPERKLRFIHIAGTNGKGSVGAMLERAFRSVGLTTGFYSSPHLIDVRERFRIDGRAVDEARFNRLGRELRDEAEGGSFSYFEFATVLAMKIFLEAGTDVVIWETGMGGRLDATNIVTPAAAVITNIALDHQAHLGHTVGAIAGEKAGIVKSGVPLFAGELVPEARAVVEARCRELGSPFSGPEAPVPDCTGFTESEGRILQHFTYCGASVALPLPGRMQRDNFRLVHAILKFFAPRWNFDFAAALRALERVRWPARCQNVAPRFWLDGGHNPDGVAALCGALHEIAPDRKKIVVYGAFQDKDFRSCLELLAPVATEFIFVPIGVGERPSVPPPELAKIAASFGRSARTADSAVAAVKMALAEPDALVVAAGSLYLAGELLAAFLPPEATLDL